MKEKNILLVFTVLLGISFLSAGISKGMDINSFGETLKLYGSNYFYLFAPFISGLEICLGFGLLFIVSPKKLSFIALLVTLSFTLIFAYGNIFLHIKDCGCYGSMLKIPPYLSYLRNILMLLVSWHIWRHYHDDPITKWTKFRFITAVVFAAVSFIISIIDLNHAYGQSEKYEGLVINSTIIPSLVRLPSTNKYLVFMLLPTCSHCQRAVAKVKSLREKGLVNDIVGIYPAHADRNEVNSFVKDFRVDFPMQAVRSDSIRFIVKSFPTIFFIRNDTIISSFIGSAPSVEDLH